MLFFTLNNFQKAYTPVHCITKSIFWIMICLVQISIFITLRPFCFFSSWYWCSLLFCCLFCGHGIFNYIPTYMLMKLFRKKCILSKTNQKHYSWITSVLEHVSRSIAVFRFCLVPCKHTRNCCFNKMKVAFEEFYSILPRIMRVNSAQFMSSKLTTPINLLYSSPKFLSQSSSRRSFMWLANK